MFLSFSYIFPCWGLWSVCTVCSHHWRRTLSPKGHPQCLQGPISWLGVMDSTANLLSDQRFRVVVILRVLLASRAGGPAPRMCPGSLFTVDPCRRPELTAPDNQGRVILPFLGKIKKQSGFDRFQCTVYIDEIFGVKYSTKVKVKMC